MTEIDQLLDEVPSPRLRRGITRHVRELRAENQRLSDLLGRTVQLAAARGVLPVAEHVLDGVMTSWMPSGASSASSTARTGRWWPPAT